LTRFRTPESVVPAQKSSRHVNSGE
jgi:hypothetical protein